MEPIIKLFLLLSAICTVSAQSSFQGVFLYPTAPDMQAIGGNFSLTLSGNQATFQSTLFDVYVTGVSLEPVIVVQGGVYPISFGSGTPANGRLRSSSARCRACLLLLPTGHPTLSTCPRRRFIRLGFALPVHGLSLMTGSPRCLQEADRFVF
jgi:hypothetical protein